jgi:hypothetical protein
MVAKASGPVLFIRTDAGLHRRIKEAAKRADRSVSDECSYRLRRSLDRAGSRSWQKTARRKIAGQNKMRIDNDETYNCAVSAAQ